LDSPIAKCLPFALRSRENHSQSVPDLDCAACPELVADRRFLSALPQNATAMEDQKGHPLPAAAREKRALARVLP
jgi:hypothetical protein